jgi:serine/threonine protein kinase
MTSAFPAQPSAQPPHDALPGGYVLGGSYRIERVLGQGGFGIVYLATDLALQRPVAIKEYLPAHLAMRGAEGPGLALRGAEHQDAFLRGLQSFLNEARLLAQFDHPSLVRVYRFWEENHTAYMAMPFCDGPTLAAARRSMLRPPEEAWLRDQLLLPLIGALEALHSANCLHRDVSPDNILLLADGRPMLLDFGSARRVAGDMTQPLTALVNPSYAAIEQFAASTSLPQGPWTDIYGLGCVAYFALSGRPPTPATVRAINDTATMPAVELGRLLEQSFPGLHYSPTLLAAIDAALAVKPGDRPQTVRELRERLSGTHVLPDVTLEGPGGEAAPAVAAAFSAPADALSEADERAIRDLIGRAIDLEPAPRRRAGAPQQRIEPRWEPSAPPPLADMPRMPERPEASEPMRKPELKVVSNAPELTPVEARPPEPVAPPEPVVEPVAAELAPTPAEAAEPAPPAPIDMLPEPLPVDAQAAPAEPAPEYVSEPVAESVTAQETALPAEDAAAMPPQAEPEPPAEPFIAAEPEPQSRDEEVPTAWVTPDSSRADVEPPPASAASERYERPRSRVPALAAAALLAALVGGALWYVAPQWHPDEASQASTERAPEAPERQVAQQAAGPGTAATKPPAASAAPAGPADAASAPTQAAPAAPAPAATVARAAPTRARSGSAAPRHETPPAPSRPTRTAANTPRDRSTPTGTARALSSGTTGSAGAHPVPHPSARSACGNRQNFALYYCMKTLCGQARYSATGECREWRAEQELR